MNGRAFSVFRPIAEASPYQGFEERVNMPDNKKKTDSKRERENINLKGKYEVDYAAKRKTPSKNHPELTPAKTQAPTKPNGEEAHDEGGAALVVARGGRQ
jgi:hypothetical protein